MWRRVKLPLILIVLLGGTAWLIYQGAQSREWLEFRSRRFWQSLAQVRLSYLTWGVLLIYCSYLFRSLRWREFLRPIKAAGLGNIFTSTLIGFSAVALLGRPGELVRPFLIARKEQVALSSQFAAWTLERIFDALTADGCAVHRPVALVGIACALAAMALAAMLSPMTSERARADVNASGTWRISFTAVADGHQGFFMGCHGP